LRKDRQNGTASGYPDDIAAAGRHIPF
jgi:hypothetical protein